MVGRYRKPKAVKRRDEACSSKPGQRLRLPGREIQELERAIQFCEVCALILHNKVIAIAQRSFVNLALFAVANRNFPDGGFPADVLGIVNPVR